MDRPLCGLKVEPDEKMSSSSNKILGTDPFTWRKVFSEIRAPAGELNCYHPAQGESRPPPRTRLV
jgi:hypothetical protein